MSEERDNVGIGAAKFDDCADNVVDLVADAALFVDAVARLITLNDERMTSRGFASISICP